ncbi:hypothetical protein GW916_01400 [bacterium]|nr:hypothetical protein [bacterium]
MKILIGLILVGMSLGALAEPYDIYGTWSYSGQIQSSHKIEIEVVRAVGKKGEKRLAELREQKYSCLHLRSQTYRCSRVSTEAWEPEASHLEALSQIHRGRVFELVKQPGEPKLIRSGDSLNQWSLPVILYALGEKTADVIYWETKGGLDKLDFSLGGENFWPYFNDGERMIFLDEVFESSEDRQAHYYYDVIYQRE